MGNIINSLLFQCAICLLCHYFGVLNQRVIQALSLLSLPHLYAYSMLNALDRKAPINSFVRVFVITSFFYAIVFCAHRLGVLD